MNYDKRLQSLDDARVQHPRMWKFFIIKNYLDTGRSLLGYFNPITTSITYGFGGTGILKGNWKFLALAATTEIIHNLIAYYVGYQWFKKDFYEVGNEFGNMFNPTIRRIEKRLEKIDGKLRSYYH